jgi:small subunit ribosomal protein S6
MAEKSAYDLMVLIDPDIAEERRSAILSDIKRQIDSGDGELKGDADWGVRKLAYEIDHRPEAYYHLFQLEAAPELLSQLEHSLAIDDGVLRHRILRLPKGVPETTPKAPPPSTRPERDGGERGPSRERGGERGPASERPSGDRSGEGNGGGEEASRGEEGDASGAGEPGETSETREAAQPTESPPA